MKVAILQELLTVRGGAERVARIFADMFPEAPVYTLLYDEQKLGEWFPKNRVRVAKPPTTYNLLPTNYRHNHHFYLRHFPTMIESFDFSEFDVLISGSSAFAHGAITNGKPKHLCYVHAPMRYVWDATHDVIEKASKGPLGKLKKRYLQKTFHDLRLWDAEVAPRPDTLITSSHDVQRRIELYWRREADVIHPPIDDIFFEAPGKNVEMEHPHYFLIVSTLTPYKRVDLAIEACKRCNVHLKIVGEGPIKSQLEHSAGSNVEFYGFRQYDELKDLYANAKALIFPSYDDFGLVPVEAMSQGTPVIAFGEGGALETVIDGETGTFFSEQTVESLIEVLQHFDHKMYSRDACKKRAKLFQRSRFEEAIQKKIEEMIH